MTENKYKSLLLLISAIVIALILPIQNSLYSDDVAFSQSVRHFLQTGYLKVSEYTAVSSLSHILWGTLFASVLGFSFQSVIVSVVVFLPILAISLFSIFRELGIAKTKSFFFTLFLLAVPWIFFMTFTFMSEIPFLTLEILTMLFYIKFTKSTTLKYLYISLVFATVAFLMRQLGLALIFGVAIGGLIESRLSPKKLKAFIGPMLVPALAIVVYQAWLSIPGNKTIPQFVYEKQTVDTLKNLLPFTDVSSFDRLNNLTLLIHRCLNYASHAMALMLPIVLTFTLSNLNKARSAISKNLKTILFSSAVVGAIYLLDVINFRRGYTAGFPLILYEYESFLPIPWPHVWKFLVIFSIPFWSTSLIKSISGIKKQNLINWYLIVTFLSILFMTIITFHSWERYIIPLIPFAFIFLALTSKDLTYLWIEKLSNQKTLLMYGMILPKD